jgi:DNA polymerase-3 subunit epsilon
MAQVLEASGRYRVLRRLERPRFKLGSAIGQVRRGIILDLETTGLDPKTDEIIEIGMVPFDYDVGGQVVCVGAPFSRLRQPSKPIPPEITKVTGITDAMVEGQVIDPAEVEAFIGEAALIIAHNAAFDRRFAERFCPGFVAKPWACSLSQIDWKGAGYESGKLAFLAAAYGFFHDGHRAHHDCLATLEILGAPLAGTDATGLQALLVAARKTTVRIFAENSPFELKDVLKARGYRWNGEAGPSPRAWWIDVEEAALSAELDYLQTEIYRGEVHLPTRKVTAFERFSERT